MTMTRTYFKLCTLAAAMLLSATRGLAQTPLSMATGADSTAVLLPHEAVDTIVVQSTDVPDSVYVLPTEGIITSKIHLITRSYADQVVLRWLPEDYVSWLFLRQYGVNVLRVEHNTLDIDTLAYALKPLTRQQMEARYPTTDQQAMVAMGVMYGEGRLAANQTQDQPGTMGANMEYNSEQDVSFGYAMLVAEWRRDLAEAMAVGFTDRTAKRGVEYDYYVQVTQWELDGKILFEPGVREQVQLESFKPEPYDPMVMDTLTAPRRVAISWIDTDHSSYEIERREEGTKEWTRLNDKPYVSMISDNDLKGLCIYSDSVDHDGTWEYRIMAHDAFGELTPATEVHKAYVRDIEAPKAPQITQIVIDRPDGDDNPSSRVLAHVFWRNNDPLEADLQGYLVHYYNEQFTGSQWQPMNDQLLSPRDTMCTIDVSGLRTGMLCLRAYDDSGNESQSLEQLIRITDLRAPLPPDTIYHRIMPNGYVLLSWEPNPADDDIMYHDVAFANDLTHEFLLRNEGGLPDPMFVDTLALDVNQKYIYYKVRAVDYSGNVGLWSPVLRVLRPHNTPPTVPHIDLSSHDEKGMHMSWVVGIDADMDFHVLKRRLGPEGEWQVLARWDADSLNTIDNHVLQVDDNPPYHSQLRYYYMVESHNSSPYTSQSLAISWLHEGPKFLDIPIRLSGDYVESAKAVRLVWETGAIPADLMAATPAAADSLSATPTYDYYYCVFRKGPDDKKFKYMYNVLPTDLEFTDATLQSGQQAQYYVILRFRDGRESRESNIVTVARR